MDEQLLHYLPRWLTGQYQLQNPISIKLLRHYTNDVFKVDAGDQSYVLKIYATDWRSDLAIMFEVELLDFLRQHGIDVAVAIKDESGEALQKIELDGGSMQAVLFEFAPGFKPQPPFSLADYEVEGRALAAMHAAADGFTTAHDRPALDVAFLIDRPLTYVESVAGDLSVTKELVQMSSWIRQNLEKFIDHGLDWGICHGDVTFDNFHLTKDGRTVWYDFDSGGFGWRGIDLQGWAFFDPDKQPRQEALIKAYRRVRPISDLDVESAAFLYAAQEVWGLEVELRYRILDQGQAAVEKFLAEQIEAFRHRCKILSEQSIF